MADLALIDRYLQENRQSQLDSLFELLRIPSISADPSQRAELLKAADWVKDFLESAGVKTELITDPDGSGAPIVYGETAPVPGAPVVLVYGHYDVQPCDPLELWKSPPFEPEIRDGNIYARGATDDKGQMLTHLMAVKAWKEAGQTLPVQVKFLIEGEEEHGSQFIEKVLPKIADKIRCDVLVISDSSQYAKGQPAITYGLRGLAYFEIHAQGPKIDLHSGTFGGAVTNPAIALASLLSKMKDDDGRIQLPGFYDPVKPLTESERAMWASLPFSDEAFAEQLGVSELSGEAGYTTLERRWARPTFDIHGLSGGYQGEGAKTVIPAKASAKISFRLVPNQNPTQVADQLRQFVADHPIPGVTFDVVDLHGGLGVVVDPNSKFMAGASRAVEEGFGTKPVLMRQGGSIPIVADIVNSVGCDVLLMGWGLDDDATHSPNEKFSLEDYYRGIRSSSRLWQYLAP